MYVSVRNDCNLSFSPDEDGAEPADDEGRLRVAQPTIAKSTHNITHTVLSMMESLFD